MINSSRLLAEEALKKHRCEVLGPESSDFDSLNLRFPRTQHK